MLNTPLLWISNDDASGLAVIGARAIVLATDGTELQGWVPGCPEVESRAVTCLYFAADTSPLDEPILVLNGEPDGVISNLCVPSDVSPQYAPAGASLISVTVLGNPSWMPWNYKELFMAN